MRFAKYHALGNDYLVLEETDWPDLDAKIVRRLCDRHFGIGSDGVLLRVASAYGAQRVRIFNPDGSEAEKSGNGLRIFARYLYDHRLTSKTQFTIETPGGLVGILLDVRDGDVGQITVDMGAATFASDRIPVTGAPREVVNELIDVAGRPLTITAVSVGNPHCVVFVPALADVDLETLGPFLERHPAFPNRTNVQFAEVRSRRRIAILIWERGAGVTMASGSSACAVAAAAVRKGLADRNVTIEMPGGSLEISVAEDWSIRMTGPAVEVYSGTFSEAFVQSLRS